MTTGETQKLISGKKRDATNIRAQDMAFRTMYYTIAWMQVLSILIFLAGQTSCIFFYDWTVKYGLQENQEEIGANLVQVNRAFGASDTVIYIPLLATSAYGLFSKKRWSLICTAASAGIHCYWATTCFFSFLFLGSNHSKEYTHHRPIGIWMFVEFYVLYGVSLLMFIYHYNDILLTFMD